jgi:putative Mg2+ transporter-C (MgtC) family protein
VVDADVSVMTEIVGWQPILLRLLLTVLAGFLIGFDRGENGEPAGLRTTLLVCLAASIAMIQANLLLGTAGRPPDSYVVFDLMRFPLGILTGVGFIGAGAIFRQDNLLRGVTTAATLWFVTVIGLCIGGGQLGLGAVGTALGLVVLWGLKAVERWLPTQKSALLILVADAEGPTASDLRGLLARAGFRVINFGETCVNGNHRRRTMRCHVRWRGAPHDTGTPNAITELAGVGGVLQMHWAP